MPTQLLTGPAANRIGVQNGEILAHAQPKECLGIAGNHKKMRKNMGKTVIYRRYLPYGGASTNSTTINRWSVDPNLHLTQEAVTPLADTLAKQDVTVTINNYACLYMYSDEVVDYHEDDIPGEQRQQIGERMGLVREMIRYGTLKGCTNKFYSGGSSRATVADTITLPLLRRVSRSILGNRGMMVTGVLAPGVRFNTTPIEASFLVFVHTDAEHDVRALPDFVPCVSYGKTEKVHEMEIGSTDRYRFILSPELASIADAGAAVGSTGLESTGNSNIDVYPFIVVARNAWADLALRGTAAFQTFHQRPSDADKSDPLGQRGYCGAKFASAAFIENDGWMAVIEAGVTDLAA